MFYPDSAVSVAAALSSRPGLLADLGGSVSADWTRCTDRTPRAGPLHCHRSPVSASGSPQPERSRLLGTDLLDGVLEEREIGGKYLVTVRCVIVELELGNQLLSNAL